jgi:hypothetical protein
LVRVCRLGRMVVGECHRHTLSRGYSPRTSARNALADYHNREKLLR